MRISYWSSDVCSSDLPVYGEGQGRLKLQGCGRAERGDAQASRTGERKAQALGVIARLQRQGERHAAGLATAQGKALRFGAAVEAASGGHRHTRGQGTDGRVHVDIRGRATITKTN